MIFSVKEHLLLLVYKDVSTAACTEGVWQWYKHIHTCLKILINMTTNVQIVVIIMQSTQLFLLQKPGMHVVQVSAYDVDPCITCSPWLE